MYSRRLLTVFVSGLVLILALAVLFLGITVGFIGAGAVMGTSYFADDKDVYAAEEYYSALELSLQYGLNNIENTYPGYDEYTYSIVQTGHNPYELISYLTAKYADFSFAEIRTELNIIFNRQYNLTLDESTEMRDERLYKILKVTLENNGISSCANDNLTLEQRELYGIYLETKGNRSYLFQDDIYSNISRLPPYSISAEALEDSKFKALITEAEKYLGYPYVWGGSSPSTSFDCSGFVCWVFKNSDVYPLERTTAQGIFNQCSVIPPEEAKPGDIIFFTGTYNSGTAVSHVGIYVGDKKMLHCGSPIQYADIEQSYWQSHFYAFGRLDCYAEGDF